MSVAEALDSLRTAVLDADAPGIARFADAAARAGASREAVRGVLEQARHARGEIDALRSVADALELSLLEEQPGGIAPRTRAAERHVGVGFPGTMADAIERITGPLADARLPAFLAGARGGGTAQTVVAAQDGASYRVLAFRRPADLLRVLVARTATASTTGRERRPSDAYVLATVNHEMANALTAIASIASFSLRQPGDDGLREAIEAVAEAASGTLSSVHAARRLARRDASEAPAPTDASRVLSQLIDALRPLADRTNVRVTARIEPSLTASIRTTDLRSIVWNLLKNAIEAVPPGGTVRVGATGATDTLRIVVDDDGPGMTDEVLARAFEPYFSTKEAGMGLGLALVRETLERLGGRIGAESRPGAGSRFTVEIPIREAPAEIATSGVVPRLRLGSRILIVGKAGALPLRLRGLGAIVHEVSGTAAAESTDEVFDVAMVVTEGDGAVSEDVAATLAKAGIAQHLVQIAGDSPTVAGYAAAVPADVDAGTLADVIAGLARSPARAESG